MKAKGFKLPYATGVAILLLLCRGPLFAQVGGAVTSVPAWQPPTAESIRTQIFAWLDVGQADAAVKASAEELWAALPKPPAEEEILECVAQTCALADPDAKKLVALCAQPRKALILSPQPWLQASRTAPLVARNLRLYYARWLVQNALFDEARQQLAGLRIDGVVAPATLLFYQSVVYHKLLERESGLQTLDYLLDGPPTTPRRYAALAVLMHEDLQMLEDDSLDHIARRMDDIRRRLDLGRAGSKVQGVERGVIESLDKLIKKLEEQQKKACGGGGNSIQSSRPAQDSYIIGGKGQGRVTRKHVGDQSGWGNLPPKEREEALQQIGRDFPAHYRDVIEEYFKRLASEENP